MSFINKEFYLNVKRSSGEALRNNAWTCGIFQLVLYAFFIIANISQIKDTY